MHSGYAWRNTLAMGMGRDRRALGMSYPAGLNLRKFAGAGKDLVNKHDPLVNAVHGIRGKTGKGFDANGKPSAQSNFGTELGR
jgi:hypothetical protein